MDMELENMLRPPEIKMPDYPPKVITLANGKKLVVRPVQRRDVPKLLPSVRPTLKIARDFYNVVGSRVYSELLAWQYHRLRNGYTLVGQIDNVLVGIVNGRMYDEKIGISLHTLAISRGLRIGAHLFAAKMEHHIEYLNQEEVWITAESPIGFRRWMIEYELIEQEGVQHELGGAQSFKLTRELYFKHKPRLVAGTRPCPEDLLEKARSEFKFADEKTISEQICGAKGARKK